MNEKRAQEILRHITQDHDHGSMVLNNLSLEDSIYVEAMLLPNCIRQANSAGNFNDESYFDSVSRRYRSVVIDKIKKAERLWVVYCDSTGYPYEADKDLFILFQFSNHKLVMENFQKAGFKVTLADIDSEGFRNEVIHMYRNGYKAIRFIDGKYEPFVVNREELYSFADYYPADYVTNPGLQYSMISFFQEFRKTEEIGLRAEIIKKREDEMIQNLLHAEYMVPCTKTESEDKVEISHPFFDLTENLKPEDGLKVIAIPVFTDGFELDKCYKDQHETMLYNFKELAGLTEELEAGGIMLNALGVSYYLPGDAIKKILHQFS